MSTRADIQAAADALAAEEAVAPTPTHMTEIISPSLGSVEEIMALPLAEQRARIAEVRDRASSLDRLRVNLPDHLVGQWVHKSNVSIAEAHMMGWRDGSEYAKAGLNGDGVHGDCVFMVMARAIYELHKDDEHRNMLRHHAETGGMQTEERGFMNEVIEQDERYLTPMTDSRVNRLSGHDVKRAVQR